jgi:glyoxylase-like metal-dependent hydrolase (beta-lactamase superfamily II)
MKYSYLVLMLAALTGSNAAQAAAEQVKTQAPGYYRMMVGQTEITVLNDGTVDLPIDQLLQQPAAQTQAQLQHYHLTLPVETSVNAYLVNTGDKLVLIDVGAGTLFGPTLGNVSKNLHAAGYRPEQVDEIYITHMHADHVGGLVADGNRVYPNAVVRVDQKEADFWLSDAEMAKAPDDKKGFFKNAMTSLRPYQAAGKLKTFTGQPELVKGISVQATHGHTAGHVSYRIHSDEQQLLVLGDIIHVAAVQFDNPAVTIGFDSTPEQAKAQRLAVFKQAAAQGLMLSATHLQFPGIGYVVAAGDGYRWIPANYQRIK